MAIELIAQGNKVVQVDAVDGNSVFAVCDEPEKAISLMLKGWELNGQRKYTASARCFAQVEQLPGFAWAQNVYGKR